jgi:predicted MPP superfamily phosphohydrolase
MNKVVYIGDIHGRDVWKEIVKKHSDADTFVFIGDYFDSFYVSGINQLRNVEEIVEFKKLVELDPNKKVYLLIGNHDIHYWPGIKDRGGTSGFQPTMMFQFEQFFRDNESMFQMAVSFGTSTSKRLCTHAGVSSQFLKDVGYWTHDKHSRESYVAQFLNDLFKYKPNEFTFVSYADRYLGYVDGSGDNEAQSPIWIRPRSLQKSNKDSDMKKMYVQIVGHTVQNNIDIKGKTTGGKYYYIDTLPSGEYLVEIDGEFSVDYSTTEKKI